MTPGPLPPTVSTSGTLHQHLSTSAPFNKMAELGPRYAGAFSAFLLEYLQNPANLDSPQVFATYVRWTRKMVRARGVTTEMFRAGLQAAQGALAHAGDPRVARLLEVGLAAVDEPEPVATAPAPIPEDIAEYAKAATAGQRARVLALTERWRLEGGPAHALKQIARAQREVGESWMRAEITVAGEHRASCLSQVALSMLVPFIVGNDAPRPRGRALVACAPGDYHVLGARIGADLLELDGWEVHFLGANTPAEELVQVVRELAPSLVGLGVATIGVVAGARQAIAAVRQARPECQLIAGGWAAGQVGARELGADALAP